MSGEEDDGDFICIPSEFKPVNMPASHFDFEKQMNEWTLYWFNNNF